MPYVVEYQEITWRKFAEFPNLALAHECLRNARSLVPYAGWRVAVNGAIPTEYLP